MGNFKPHAFLAPSQVKVQWSTSMDFPTMSIELPHTTSIFEEPRGQRIAIDIPKRKVLYSVDGEIFYPLVVTGFEPIKKNEYNFFYQDPYNDDIGTIILLGDEVWRNSVTFTKLVVNYQVEIIPFEALRKPLHLFRFMHDSDNRYIFISKDMRDGKKLFHLYVGPRQSMSSFSFVEDNEEESTIKITTSLGTLLSFKGYDYETYWKWNEFSLEKLDIGDYVIDECRRPIYIILRKYAKA